VDRRLRREVLRKATYGIYVVTARLGEQWSASTVTWLSQCSLEPPLLMMAIQKKGGLRALIKKNPAAIVHILGAGQKSIASDFLKATRHKDGRLNGHPYALVRDLPLLTEIPWYCVVEARDWIERGDHSVLVAEIVDVGKNVDADLPLVMWDTGWTYGG